MTFYVAADSDNDRSPLCTPPLTPVTEVPPVFTLNTSAHCTSIPKSQTTYNIQQPQNIYLVNFFYTKIII